MYTYALIVHINDIVGLLRDGFPTYMECFRYGRALEMSDILMEPYTLECIADLWV